MTTVIFDATRLYMRASLASPTGIDRVTEAYGRWLLSRGDVSVVPACTIGGVISPLSLDGFRQILQAKSSPDAPDEANWRRLVAALNGPTEADQGLRTPASREGAAARIVRYAGFGLRTMAGWRPTWPSGDAIFLNVSHYGLEQPRLLNRVTARGWRVVAMIHDLIPISHPEFCSASALGWHLRRVGALLDHRAVIIANSQATATELTAYAEATGRAPPSIFVAPLGLEPEFAHCPQESVSSRPYFVCVGTIEPRKNVHFLLRLWRRLAERMGPDTPWLVLAGRRGWESEAIIDHLERSPPIRRFVHEVSHLGDRDLARLIAGANALLAPSSCEGFNLPVAEATALGTPVIASDIPVHREFASHARLLDPVDGLAWLAAIEDAALRRPSADPSRPFDWPSHFAIAGQALGLAPN